MSDDPDFAAIVGDVEPEAATHLLDYMAARAERSERRHELLRSLSHERALMLVIVLANHLEQAFDVYYSEVTAHARHHMAQPDPKPEVWGRLNQSMAEFADFLVQNDHIGRLMRGELDDDPES